MRCRGSSSCEDDDETLFTDCDDFAIFLMIHSATPQTEPGALVDLGIGREGVKALNVRGGVMQCRERLPPNCAWPNAMSVRPTTRFTLCAFCQMAFQAHVQVVKPTFIMPPVIALFEDLAARASSGGGEGGAGVRPLKRRRGEQARIAPSTARAHGVMCATCNGWPALAESSARRGFVSASDTLPASSAHRTSSA